MKIALVHDDFMQSGGAESLFATIASIYPDAPIYTSLVDWAKIPSSINKNRIKTSFIQKIPFAKKLYKILLLLYPLAFETFDLSKFDIVISSTTRFAKGVITKPNSIHICYINNLPRFLWDENIKKEYVPSYLNFIAKPIFRWLKRWDLAASKRPDFYISNSQNVADRIKEKYQIKSHVIYPFADLNFFTPAKLHNWQLKSRNYFLVVSRLVKWKKIDLAIEVAGNLGLNLKIVGTGPDEKRLKKLTLSVIPTPSKGRSSPEGEAGIHGKEGSIEFLGKVTSHELSELYRNAKALIVPQEEDFGIAAVEAQASGIPVIAYKNGGMAEIVIDKKTGILFEKQTEKSLQDAIETSLAVKWSLSACRKNSQRFSKAVFVGNLKKAINSYDPKSQ